MSLLDILLSLLILLSSGFFAVLTYNEKRPVHRGFAFGLTVLGFVLAILQGAQFFNPTAKTATTALGKESVKVTGQNIAILKPNGTIHAGEKIDLNQVTLTEDMIEAKKKESAFYILDASEGILPANLAVLKNLFTDLNVQAAEKDEKADICWQRQALFTVATGLCQTRPIKWLLNASENDLTRTKDQFSTARIIEVNRSRFLLLTHQLPVKEASVEEQCLQALVQGNACAAVEILPSASTAALNITTTDPTVQSVLEEFSVAVPQDLNESLSIYSNIETPLIEKLANVKNSDASNCGGLFVSPNLHMKILELDEVSEGLKQSDTESKLSKEAKQLTKYLSCAGLSHLDLQKMKKRDLKTSARSFMTHAMKYSFWFTDVKSYLNRFHKTQLVQLSTDEAQQKVAMGSVESLKGLSISFVTPVRFPEEMLQNISVLNATSDWSLYRMGAYAFRVSIDKPTAQTIIDTSSFFTALEGNRLGFEGFFGSVGVLPALLVAFILATILVFIHVTASRRAVLWGLTFAPVFSISFILIFLSIVSSRLPSGNDTSFAQMENPVAPSHIFLRDWPDQWLDKVGEARSQMAFMAQKQSEKWSQGLKAAESNVSRMQSEKNIGFLSPNLIYKNKIAGSRNIIVWDYPAARNFYFRKSSVYPALILGWRELAQAQKNIQISSAANFQELGASLGKSILVIPDMNLIGHDDLSAVDNFVKAGGTLVFSEKLDERSESSELKESSEFVNALKSAGLGRTALAHYSKINVEGVSVSSINTDHRILKTGSSLTHGEKWGQGSVVFLGVQPLDGSSRTLLTELFSRLQGEKKTVYNVGAGCATALFIQPWATNAFTLETFARAVRQSGYDLKWMLDPVSLAKMSGTWENRLRNDGVVFLDDGKAQTRQLAGEMIKLLQGATAKPIFVSLKNNNENALEGPQGEMIVAQQIDEADISYQSKLWSADCKLGVAQPRFITGGNKAEDWTRKAQVLKANAPKNLLGLSAYIQRLRDLKTDPQNIETKEINYNSQDPLEMISE